MGNSITAAKLGVEAYFLQLWSSMFKKPYNREAVVSYSCDTVGLTEQQKANLGKLLRWGQTSANEWVNFKAIEKANRLRETWKWYDGMAHQPNVPSGPPVVKTRRPEVVLYREFLDSIHEHVLGRRSFAEDYGPGEAEYEDRFRRTRQLYEPRFYSTYAYFCARPKMYEPPYTLETLFLFNWIRAQGASVNCSRFEQLIGLELEMIDEETEFDPPEESSAAVHGRYVFGSGSEVVNESQAPVHVEDQKLRAIAEDTQEEDDDSDVSAMTIPFEQDDEFESDTAVSEGEIIEVTSFNPFLGLGEAQDGRRFSRRIYFNNVHEAAGNVQPDENLNHY